MLIASRSRSRLNWSRLLVSDRLVEIGADDLRFRSWEVEQLFSDFYEEPMPPDDLADLARRTEGWVAGLKLFHLATKGRSEEQRRRVLASLRTRWSVAREYLARNVLEGLEPEVREFLLETCVLTLLSGRICDALLGRRGSEGVLRELVARQLFTHEVDVDAFRYHETLRSQLELMLVETLGERDTLRRFRRAGALLEAHGELPDAVRAYGRAGAWGDVQRLLGRDGDRVVRDEPLWLDELPPSILESDPWLLLALARRQRSIGRFAAAVETYKRAESLARGSVVGTTFRSERVALAQWLEPNAPRSGDAIGILRGATVRDPVLAGQAAARLGTAEGLTVSGLCALLAGACGEAARIFERATESLEPRSFAAAAAQLGRAVAHLLSSDTAGGSEASAAAESAETAGVFWLARLAHAALALGSPSGGAAATEARIMSEHEGNDWVACLAALFEGLGALREGNTLSSCSRARPPAFVPSVQGLSRRGRAGHSQSPSRAPAIPTPARSPSRRRTLPATSES
ncbi:MAG: hypothetical protein FJW96_16935 [Actinobacteria bacterium]|nr:hypothetical protein [Actinomycetota bacterium]